MIASVHLRADPHRGHDGHVRLGVAAPCRGLRNAVCEMLDAAPTVTAPVEPVTVMPLHANARVPQRGVRLSQRRGTGADGHLVHGVPGQTLAVVGSTGAGKSTLVNLGPRLYDATGGTVLVNGVDVRDVPMELLWEHIGLVPQRPYLFTGTVASNLRYGNANADGRRALGGTRDRGGA